MNPRALRILRAGTGLLLAFNMLSLWPDLPVLYGVDGLVDPELLQLQRYDHGLSVAQAVRAVSDFFDIAPLIALRLLAGCYILLAVLFAAGWYTPVVGLALLGLHAVWYSVQPHWSYGVDFLGATAIAYGLCYRAPHHWLTKPTLRILQLHLCIIYFFGGLSKLLGTTWHNGEAIWKALNQPYHRAGASEVVSMLGDYPLVVAGLGYGVVVLELGYAFFMWLPVTRTYWLGGILAMHIGIAFFIGLYQFAALMLLLNLTAFYYTYANNTKQTPIHIPLAPTASKK